jgi:hypothetical protein
MHLGDAAAGLALVAVGGYGRGELHPCSDIDILVIVPEGDGAWRDRVAAFLTFLWDIGLEVGHSVRSVAECARQAEADVTVVTTLMESRLLDGPAALFEGHAGGDQPGAAVATAGVLRGQARRADRPPSPLSRHRPQPRAQHQGQPRRPARHPGGLLGGAPPLRHRQPAPARPAGLPHRLRVPPAARRARTSCGASAGRSTPSPGRREDRLLFDHRSSWPRCSATKMPASPSRSSSSCRSTTGRCRNSPG